MKKYLAFILVILLSGCGQEPAKVTFQGSLKVELADDIKSENVVLIDYSTIIKDRNGAEIEFVLNKKINSFWISIFDKDDRYLDKRPGKYFHTGQYELVSQIWWDDNKVQELTPRSYIYKETLPVFSPSLVQKIVISLN